MAERQKRVAEESRERHGYRSDLHHDFQEKFPESGKQTRDIIGKELGVSGRQYDKIKVINDKATPETIQLVRDGKLSINQAYNSVCPKKPDPVKQAKQEHEAFQEQKKESVVSFQNAQLDRINQNIINNALFQDVLKLLNSVNSFGINHKIEELEGLDIEQAERRRIVEQCEACRRILLQIETHISEGKT